MTNNRKWVCTECDTHIEPGALLSAPNPFDEQQSISGCPHCSGVECFERACDEPSCWQEATIGTPTPDGYKSFCSKHEMPYLASKGEQRR